MSIHKEISLEEEICDHLAANGWLYATGDAAAYDRPRALFPTYPPPAEVGAVVEPVLRARLGR